MHFNTHLTTWIFPHRLRPSRCLRNMLPEGRTLAPLKINLPDAMRQRQRNDIKPLLTPQSPVVPRFNLTEDNLKRHDKITGKRHLGHCNSCPRLIHWLQEIDDTNISHTDLVQKYEREQDREAEHRLFGLLSPSLERHGQSPQTKRHRIRIVPE